jgi:hypothetical protein
MVKLYTDYSHRQTLLVGNREGFDQHKSYGDVVPDPS